MAARMKFILGGIVIVAALAWLGFVGFQESKAYYITVDEYHRLATDRFLRSLTADVAPSRGRARFSLKEGAVPSGLKSASGIVLPGASLGQAPTRFSCRGRTGKRLISTPTAASAMRMS